MRTRVTERLGIEVPIVQGGLAHLAFAGLAAAVSNAGGLGQITATSLDTVDQLEEQIREVRRLTDRPFGVNFALGRRDIGAMLELVIDERVPVVSLTAGNPEPVIQRLRGTGIRILVLVAGVRQAQKAEALGADAVIAVGFEGGGHIGRDDIGTIVLVRRVVKSVGIPVLASGGIGDGCGLAAALALGAEGVEMGTRFIATQECIAHPHYKEALLRGRETDTVVIERTLGRPGRAVRTAWAEAILAAEARGASVEELVPMISGKMNKRAAIEGAMDEGFAWAGQVMGLIEDIPTCGELIRRMVDEAREQWRTMGRWLGTLDA
ncbi:MAG: nitronate monooxygenase [Clostridia bacterium]|nr:nitronate monooxygenase [Clostridia bacterium]